MSRKYIDFAPMNVRKSATKKPSAGRTTPKAPTEEPIIESVSEVDAVYEEVIVEQGVTNKATKSFSLRGEPEYGVVETLQPKFVKTEVPKRPLSQKRSGKIDDVAAIKAEKVGARKTLRHVEKPVENSASSDSKSPDSNKMQIPKSPFINHAKVSKRPLSKNVYEKKIEPTAEEDVGLVTIITKPEKDKRAGLVVAIILTIILGAAAGTIAFLLLPK